MREAVDQDNRRAPCERCGSWLFNRHQYWHGVDSVTWRRMSTKVLAGEAVQPSQRELENTQVRSDANAVEEIEAQALA